MNHSMYVLNPDHSTSLELDSKRWYKSFATMDRTVRKTMVRGGLVSTVFIGLDHNFGGRGPPLLFESMYFPSDGGDGDNDMDRYSTWDEALVGHEAMVEKWSEASVRQQTRREW